MESASPTESFKAGTRRKQENKAEVSKRSYLLFCQAAPAGGRILLWARKDKNHRDKLNQLEGVT